MYRVNVLTHGKHNNVTTGPRYCFTRKTAKRLAKLFVDSDCDVTIHKFVRIIDHFAWSDCYDEVGFDIDDLIEDDEGL